MNFQDMVYRLVIDILSNTSIYLKFIILVLVIRGDITKGLINLKEFFKKVIIRLKTKGE